MDIRVLHVPARVDEHIQRDIEGVYFIKYPRELTRDTAGAAADLDTGFGLEPVALPVLVKIAPIRFTERIEAFIRPWLRAVAILAGQRGHAVEGVFASPGSPFNV